jgi:antitoxin MazE
LKLRLARWGNSLAVRLPADYLRETGLSEGDELEAEMTATGEIRLQAVQAFDKAAFLERVKRLRDTLPATRPSVAVLRQHERY